jgi:hypothetical protein
LGLFNSPVSGWRHPGESWVVPPVRGSKKGYLLGYFRYTDPWVGKVENIEKFTFIRNVIIA